MKKSLKINQNIEDIILHKINKKKCQFCHLQNNVNFEEILKAFNLAEPNYVLNVSFKTELDAAKSLTDKDYKQVQLNLKKALLKKQAIEGSVGSVDEADAAQKTEDAAKAEETRRNTNPTKLERLSESFDRANDDLKERDARVERECKQRVVAIEKNINQFENEETIPPIFKMTLRII